MTEKRHARYFEVPRLAHGDTIYANELQNIREFTGTSDAYPLHICMRPEMLQSGRAGA